MNENHNFTLDSFKKAQENMVISNTNANGWNEDWYGRSRIERVRDYSKEEILRIVQSGDIEGQRRLSRNYFNKDGFYKRIILYYGTLLEQIGILIPHFSKSPSVTDKKRYETALAFLEDSNLKSLLTNCSIKIFTEGAYYGLIIEQDSRKKLTLLDLPNDYCRSRFKNYAGDNIVEFNVTYFNTFSSDDYRKKILSAYPSYIVKYYNKYRNGKVANPWCQVPSDKGICFPLLDGRPFFLDVIPTTIQYAEATELEIERAIEEIRKIIVQKIPITSDGTLVFEPDEAEVMHNGVVQMMKKNPNATVLTAYGDISAINSRTTIENKNSSLTAMSQNIYDNAGVSKQLFSSSGNLATADSINNDIALVSVLSHEFSNFLTNLLNNRFGSTSVSFKYDILPISLYNRSTYITDAFKLAQSGYSYLLPGMALGFSQRDIIDIKVLENKVLDLGKELLPLGSSYTASTPAKSINNETTKTLEEQGEAGAPQLPNEEKSDQTIKNIESKGGSNGWN